MPDPISDIGNLANALNSFTNSFAQLNSVRIKMAVNERNAGLNKIRQDFLAQADLDWNDPNKLTPENWREKFQAYQSQVDSYLGEIKSKNVQEQVRQYFSDSESQFQIGFSAKMAQAAKVEAQQKQVNAITMSLDNGMYDEAVRLYEEGNKFGLWSPEDDAKIYNSTILPAKGRIIANEVYSFAGTSASAAMKAISGSVTFQDFVKDGNYIKSNMDEEQQKQAIAMAIVDFNRYKDKEKRFSSLPESERREAMKNLQAIQDQADKGIDNAMIHFKEMNKNGEVIQIEDVMDVFGRYGKDASEAKLSELMAVQYQAKVNDVTASINTDVGNIIARYTVPKYNEKGELIGHSKFLTPAQGQYHLRSLDQKYQGLIRGNDKLTDEYRKAVAEIRNLIASGEADKKELFDLEFNDALTRYKLGKISGEQLAAFTIMNRHLLSYQEYSGLLKKLEENGFNDPRTIRFMSDDKGMMAEMAKIAQDDRFATNSLAKKIVKAVKGGAWDEPEVGAIMQDYMTSFVSDIASGKFRDENEIRQQFSQGFAKILADYQKGKYKPITLPLSDKRYHKELGERFNDIMVNGLYSKETTTGIYGDEINSSHKDQVLKMVLPMSFELLISSETKEGPKGEVKLTQEDMKYIVPVTGPDGSIYITYQNPREGSSWKNTAYKLVGDGNGINLVQVRRTSQGYDGDLISAIRSGKIGEVKGGKRINSASMASSVKRFRDFSSAEEFIAGSLDARSPTFNQGLSNFFIGISQSQGSLHEGAMDYIPPPRPASVQGYD